VWIISQKGETGLKSIKKHPTYCDLFCPHPILGTHNIEAGGFTVRKSDKIDGGFFNKAGFPSESPAIPKDFQDRRRLKIVGIQAPKMQLFLEFRCNMMRANWHGDFPVNTYSHRYERR
jgi:hypothetical protein